MSRETLLAEQCLTISSRGGWTRAELAGTRSTVINMIAVRSTGIERRTGVKGGTGGGPARDRGHDQDHGRGGEDLAVERGGEAEAGTEVSEVDIESEVTAERETGQV